MKKRLFALFLTIVLLANMVPAPVFAAGSASETAHNHADDPIGGETALFSPEADITEPAADRTGVSVGREAIVLSSDETPTSGTCGENVAWELSGTNLYITGSGPMTDYTWYTQVPWYELRESIQYVYINDGVSTISSYAFYGCTSLTGVTNYSTLTSIGTMAFCGCSSLTSFNMGHSVTSLGTYVFQDCTSLYSLTLSEALTELPRYMFYNCSNLQSVTLPSNLVTIGERVFAGCAFDSIIIPRSVKNIHSAAFTQCKNLTSVTFMGDAPTISGDAFTSCTLTAYYPSGNSTWTSSVRWNYGGTITWVSQTLAGSCGDSATYSLANDGTLTISGTGAMTNYTYITDNPLYDYASHVTSIVVEEGITAIGDYAFSGCTNATSVSLPEGITYIGINAFLNNSALTSLTIPSTVTTLGNGAFRGCSSVKSFSLPSGVTSLPTYIFSGCMAMESVSLPEGIYRMGDYAFYNCKSLRSITLPEKITYIGDYNFNNCLSLESIDMPATVYTIGEYAFAYCRKLQSIELSDSISSIGKDAFIHCTSLTEIVVPDSVYELPFAVFYGCTGLKSVTFPDSLQTIGDSAFYGCESLESVEFPSSVTSIGYNAFEGCDSLTTVELPTWVSTIREGAFADCANLTALSIYSGNSYYTTSSGILFNKAMSTIHTFPAGLQYTSYDVYYKVDTIANYCFKGNRYLREVEMGNHITKVGFSAFQGCTALTTAYLPYNASSIGTLLFKDCTSLTTVSFPSNIKTITNAMFDGCTSLETITIPSTVTAIDNYAFADCTGLKQVTFAGSAPTIADYAFDNVTCLCLYDADIAVWGASGDYGGDLTWARSGRCGNYVYWYLVDGELYIYGTDNMYNWSSASYWDWYYCLDEVTSIVIESGVTTIGQTAFTGCTTLTSISLPDSLSSIGNSAFSGCTGLTSLTLPAGMRSIGSNSFANCTGLTTVTLNEGLTTINSDAFLNCTGITEITIPASVSFLSSLGFHGCTGLTAITVDAGSETYFSDDRGVVYTLDGTTLVCAPAGISGEYTVREGCTTITNYAFQDCTGLTAVTIPDTVTTVSTYAFYGCTGLAQIQMSANLATLGTYAFSKCTSLTEISIPGSVATLPNNIFAGCTSLGTVTLNQGLTSLGSYAFSGCSALTEIVLPAGTEIINNYAFQNCTGMTQVTIPDTVTTIGMSAFTGCSALETVSVPDSVSSFGNYVFQNCSSLTSAKLPAGLTAIGTSTFNGCSKLTDVAIPDTVTSIGAYAFQNCAALASIRIPAGVTSIESYAFSGCSVLADLTIPASVTSIGTYAFRNCQALTTLTIPYGVATVGNYAFQGCTGLTEAVIHGSVTSLGSYALAGCTALTSVTVCSADTAIGTGAIPAAATIYCLEGSKAQTYATTNGNPCVTTAAGGELLHAYIAVVTEPTCTEGGFTTHTCAYCGDSYITDELDALGHTMENRVCTVCGYAETVAEGTCGESLSWAFLADGHLIISGEGEMEVYAAVANTPWYEYLSQVKTITLEEGVTTISKHAFRSCAALTQVNLPESLTTIGISAFRECTALTQVAIPAGTTLDTYVFYKCTALESVILPDISLVGTNAFGLCSGLTTAGPIGGDYNLQYGFSESYLPSGAFAWANSITEITLPDTITVIGTSAFENCTGLTAVTLPETLTEIQGNVFRGCTGLTNMVIPESVTSIGNDIFSGCSSLESVTLPSGLAEIPCSAFFNCSSLTQVNIPDGVTSIGFTAFEGTSSLESITLPDGLLTIEHYAFRNSAISAIQIPDTVSLLDIGAFYNCDGLTEITIPDSITEISVQLFAECDNLASVTLPDTLTAIGDGAFFTCKALTSIDLPENLTSIADAAFSQCSGLTQITIPVGITTLGEQAFCGCDNLNAVYIPGTNVTFGLNALVNSSFTALDATIFCYQGSTAEAYAQENGLVCCAAPVDSALGHSYETVVTDPTCENAGYTTHTCIYCADAYTDTETEALGHSITEGVCTVCGALFGIDNGTCGENLTWVLLENGTLIISGTGQMEGYAESRRPPWYDYAADITAIRLEEGITSIGVYAFYNFTALTSVEIPAGVTTIGTYAFQNCTALTQLTLPEGVITLDGCAFAGCTSLQNVELPQTLTTIGRYAFSNCESLTAITIPESVTVLDAAAFQFSALEHIEIPASVTAIGEQAFYNCTSLGSVVISEGVTTIGSSAFHGCTALTSVTIPSSVTAIGTQAFGECSALESIVIPESIQTISDFMFNCCTSLTNVEIPASVTAIGNGAFSSCSSLTAIVLPDQLTTIGDSAFSWCVSLTEVHIPETVTVIEKNAFYQCERLASVTLPSGLTEIAGDLFRDCSSLQSITLPETVTAIGNYAFSYCTGLESIRIPAAVTAIGDEAFSFCDALREIYVPGMNISYGSLVFDSCSPELTVFCYQGSTTEACAQEYGFTCCAAPAGEELGHAGEDGICTRCGAITLRDSGSCGTGLTWNLYGDGRMVISGSGAMDDYADAASAPWAAHAAAITSLEVEAGVTTIGKNAFRGCTALVSISFPSTLVSIGDSAFRECTALTAADIPAGATVGSYAFYKCSALASLVLPDISLVGTNAFNQCPMLTTAGPMDSSCHIRFGTNGTSLSAGAFTWCTTLEHIALPYGITRLNYDTFNSCTKLKSIDLPDSLCVIGSQAFQDCTSLQSIVIPDSITELQNGAFRGCTALEQVTLPAGITTIPGSLFQECSSLTAIVIPDGVTSISSNAFRGCTALSSVSLPDTLMSIDYNAFEGCGFTSIQLPDTVAELGSYAFEGCANLTEITIPDSISIIPAGLFDGCTALTTVNLPDTIHTIEYNVFYSCTSLTSIVIPEGVTSIGNQAFQGCSALESITLPDSLTALPDSLFSSCSSLKSITLPENLTTIGANVFQYCSSLESITLPESVTTIGDSAFCECNALQTINLPAGVTSIGSGAFRYCYALQTISIPAGVTSIGGYTFYGSGLTSISIPESVTSIGDQAFRYSSKLAELFIHGTEVTFGSYAFDQISKDVVFYCYQGSTAETYARENSRSFCAAAVGSALGHSYEEVLTEPTCRKKGAVHDVCVWCGHSVLLSEPDSLGHIYENGSCTRCGEIEGIAEGTCGVDAVWVLNDQGLLAIYGTGAVTVTNASTGGPWSDYKDQITSVFIADGIDHIASYAFRNHEAITSVSIPESVLSIGYMSFLGCTGLTSVTLPAGLTSLSERAFYAKNLETLVIPAMEVTFGTSAIHGNTTVMCYEGSTAETYAQENGIAACVAPVGETLGHVFTDYVSNGDATCTEDGTKTALCDRGCGKTHTVADEGSALGHSYESVVTEPTCTDGGYTTHTCVRCGDSYTDSETAALGHSFTDYVSNGDAACTEDGTKTALCDRGCGETHTVADEGSALGHSYESVVTEPTCESGGFTTHTCVRCDHSYTDSETAALDHSFTNYVSNGNATCTEDGTKTALCDRGCGETHTVADEGSVLGHSYESVVTEPTCESGGFTTHTCSRCGDSYTDSETAALGHSFGEWYVSTAATCTAPGQDARMCSRCGETETRSSASLGHNYKALVTAPTCEAAGYTTHTCVRCGDAYTDTETAALGHSFTDYVSDCNATCTADGTKTAACDRGCGKTDTIADEGSMREHAYGDWYHEASPTCTEQGQEYRECKDCGDVEIHKIAALGHNYESVVTEPTCTDSGYTTHACTRCRHRYTDSETAALGHSFTIYFSDGNATCIADGTETALCDRGCGETHTVTDEGSMTDHPYGDWYVILNATCITQGTERRDCTYCGAYETRTIDFTEHHYQVVVTEPTCEEGGYTTYICIHCEDTYQDSWTDPVDHELDNGTCIYCGEQFYLASGTCGENLTWLLNLDGVLTIYGSGPMTEHPWSTYSGSITSVVIGDGVTSICDEAFQGCDCLGEVSIPDSVTTIGDRAFAYGPVLTKVHISANVTHIGVNAFTGGVCGAIVVDEANPFYSADHRGVLFNKAQTTLIQAPYGLNAEYILPDTVTTIADSALTHCDDLASITFPESLTTIGKEALLNCTQLSEIHFLGDVPAMGEDAFTGVTAIVFYPATRESWTEAAKSSFSGVLSWNPITLEITAQPEDVTVPVGEQALITITADSDYALTYEWYVSDDGGATFNRDEAFTDASYYVTMSEAANGRQVYCVVSDANGNRVQSAIATMTMSPALSITKQPQDVAVASGETATVTVEATGEELTYQWYYKNAGGSKFYLTTTFTGPSYFIIMNDTRDGRQVYCVITDKYGNSVQTDTVTLSMGGELTILQQPQDVSVANGEKATVTVEASGTDLTYQWYFKNAGDSKFSLTTSFTGPTYYITMSAARAGRQVYCVITDADGNSVTTDTVTLSMTGALQITRQPQDVTVANGETATASVAASGEGLTYKWYFKNAGATKFNLTTTFTGPTYSVTMSAARDGRQVYCVITDQYGNSATTDTVTLSMGGALAITRQPQDVTAAEGATATVSLEATGEGLTYKWYFKNASATKFSLTTSFTGPTYSITMSSARAGRQVYCVVTDENGNSVTSDTVTLSMGTALEITRQPQDVTAAEGATATVTVAASGEGLTYKWYFKNAGASKFSLTTSFTGPSYSITMSSARAGRQVYCVITDKYGNSVTTNTVTLSMGTALKITLQPQDVTVASGEKATVTVAASGEGLTYQWYFKNAGDSKFSLTTSFTGPSYYITMSSARAGRQVYCVITDKYGNSVTTNTVTLNMA